MSDRPDAAQRTLLQFPVSHYCEKTRWCLDAKGIGYATRNLFPGVHRLGLRRHTRATSLPVLLDGRAVIADSTAIALYLEEKHPRPVLLPTEPAERSRTLELEDYFDRIAGPAVRRWMYAELLGEPGLAASAMATGFSPAWQRVAQLGAGLLEKGVRVHYRIDAARAVKSRAQIDEALDRLERETGGDPGCFLVGNALTLADITAASLLAPLIGPEGTPWVLAGTGLPERIRTVRDAVRKRPAGQWVLQRYQYDRERRALA